MLLRVFLVMGPGRKKEGNNVMDKRISRKIFWWIKEETSLFGFSLRFFGLCSFDRFIRIPNGTLNGAIYVTFENSLTAVNLFLRRTIQFISIAVRNFDVKNGNDIP